MTTRVKLRQMNELPSPQMDVVAFAHLAQLVYMDPEVTVALRDWLNENTPNLKTFCDRLKVRLV